MASNESCPKCQGTGWQQVERDGRSGVARCECTRASRASRLLEEARIPERYVHCELDNFEVLRPHTTASLETAKLLAEKFCEEYQMTGALGLGLLFVGKPGVGKTHLAVGIIKRLIRERSAACLFRTFPELLKEIQNSYNPISKASELSLLAPVLEAEILVLDELGAQNPSSWVRDTVGYILNYRYNENKVTILTTNFPDEPSGKTARKVISDSLTERIGDRMRSRLYEMCKTVNMVGSDFRQNMNANYHFDDAQPKAGVPTRNLLGALLVSVIGLAGLLDAQAPSHGPESIRAEELREKVSYLASDEFRGRGNGTADLDRAADYIAAAFAESGLPSGPDGSYFQEFTVERLSLGDGNVFETTGSRTEVFRPGRDFVPVTTSPNGVVEGPLAFAGYGIRAPALDYDDFSGVDVAGRIAVVLDGQPRARDRDSPFNVASLDEFSSIPSKAANAARAGAIGLIVVQGPLGSAASIGSFAARLRPGLSPRNVTMELPPDRDGTAIPTVLLSRGAGPRLLPGLRAIQAGIDRDLESRSSLLSWSARLVVDLTRDAYTARNVIARVPGSNPSLREEVVVVGAHYDHDGAENGRIWNGADDDASGTSALLELAEAFGSGVRPGRTVLLSAWAGEEMLGSRHYVRDPVEPLARTVAMVQLDMIGRNEDHPANRGQGVPAERARQNENSINVLGSIFSPEFRLLLEKSNASVGLDLRFRYDRGAENLLQRSDHWSFLVRGVPALFIFGGMHPDYHTPNDTADKINYLKMENVVKLVYHALLELGERPSGPALTNPQASQ